MDNFLVFMIFFTLILILWGMVVYNIFLSICIFKSVIRNNKKYNSELVASVIEQNEVSYLPLSKYRRRNIVIIYTLQYKINGIKYTSKTFGKNVPIVNNSTCILYDENKPKKYKLKENYITWLIFMSCVYDALLLFCFLCIISFLLVKNIMWDLFINF